MTVIIPAPFAMFDCLLTLGTNDYTAGVSQVQFDPTTTSGKFKGLTPTASYPVSGGTDWQLTLTLAQDWDTSGSLANYLIEHAGELEDVTFEPVAGGASVAASVILAPVTIGGTGGGDPAVATVQLQSTVPVITPAG